MGNHTGGRQPMGGGGSERFWELGGWMVYVVGGVGHVVAANANSGKKTKWRRNRATASLTYVAV